MLILHSLLTVEEDWGREGAANATQELSSVAV